MVRKAHHRSLALIQTLFEEHHGCSIHDVESIVGPCILCIFDLDGLFETTKEGLPAREVTGPAESTCPWPSGAKRSRGDGLGRAGETPSNCHEGPVRVTLVLRTERPPALSLSLDEVMTGENPGQTIGRDGSSLAGTLASNWLPRKN